MSQPPRVYRPHELPDLLGLKPSMARRYAAALEETLGQRVARDGQARVLTQQHVDVLLHARQLVGASGGTLSPEDAIRRAAGRPQVLAPGAAGDAGHDGNAGHDGAGGEALAWPQDEARPSLLAGQLAELPGVLAGLGEQAQELRRVLEAHAEHSLAQTARLARLEARLAAFSPEGLELDQREARLTKRLERLERSRLEVAQAAAERGVLLAEAQGLREQADGLRARLDWARAQRDADVRRSQEAEAARARAEAEARGLRQQLQEQDTLARVSAGDTVELVDDQPDAALERSSDEPGLRAGTLGVVREVFEQPARGYDVELKDASGARLALLAFRAHEIRLVAKGVTPSGRTDERAGPWWWLRPGRRRG